jgi:hypothetical protein
LTYPLVNIIDGYADKQWLMPILHHQ